MSRGLIALLTLLLAACATTPSPSASSERNRMQQAANVNVDLGLRYLRDGRLELAKEKLERALTQDPRSPDVHTALALFNERVQRPADAEAHYQRAVELRGDNPDPLNNYAAFLCRNQRPLEALPKFEQAATDPFYRTPWVALTNAGVCARRIPDDRRAEEFLRRALEQRPRDPEALLQMASLMLQTGQYLRARAFVQRLEAAGHSPPMVLALGYEVETALGDARAAQEYRSRLLQEHPDAPEARRLRRQDQNAEE